MPHLTGRAILHLHPSLHCNLACRHCYSTSGPAVRGELSSVIVHDAIRDAAQIGFEVLSVSGGEPLLYSGLAAALQAARQHGLITSVITNGYLIGSPSGRSVADLIDILVLSVDGPPDVHNHIRGRRDAFDRLESAIDLLRAERRRFGLVHTVSRASLDELDWLLEFSVNSGASTLQLHPLEMSGRATGAMVDQSLDADELISLYIAAGTAAIALPDRLSIQTDLIHTDFLAAHPELFCHLGEGVERGGGIRGRLLCSPLVIEPDGMVVPLAFGFAREFALTKLQGESLLDAWHEKSGQFLRRLNGLLLNVRDRLLMGDRPVVNWYEEVMSAGLEHSALWPRQNPRDVDSGREVLGRNV